MINSKHTVKNMKSGAKNNRLYCFPYAGGYSLSFKPLVRQMSKELNISAIDPPGHGSNKSPYLKDIYDMVDLYEEIFIPLKGTTFSLFGHSLGGLIVYLLTQKLEDKGIYPDKLILSGCNPPAFMEEKTSTMTDEEFKAYITELGGVPEKVINNKALLNYYIPSLRADFLALENFKYEKKEIIRTPVYIINGEDDRKCIYSNACNWTYYCKNPTFFSVKGSHMFITSQSKHVAQILDNILLSA